jgi:hypothetical protein
VAGPPAPARRPYDRSDVARVLYGVEDDETKTVGERERSEIVPGNFGDGENTLRRFGARGRREFGGGDFLHRNTTLSQRRKQ